MSRVVLSGYYGFNNLGDEAVLAATVDALRARRPDVEIAVLSAAPAATGRLFAVEGVPRAGLRALVRVLRRCARFLRAGGSRLPRVPRSPRPRHVLVLCARARLFG